MADRRINFAGRTKFGTIAYWSSYGLTEEEITDEAIGVMVERGVKRAVAIRKFSQPLDWKEILGDKAEGELWVVES